MSRCSLGSLWLTKSGRCQWPDMFDASSVTPTRSASEGSSLILPRSRVGLVFPLQYSPIMRSHLTPEDRAAIEQRLAEIAAEQDAIPACSSALTGEAAKRFDRLYREMLTLEQQLEN